MLFAVLGGGKGEVFGEDLAKIGFIVKIQGGGDLVCRLIGGYQKAAGSA